MGTRGLVKGAESNSHLTPPVASHNSEEWMLCLWKCIRILSLHNRGFWFWLKKAVTPCSHPEPLGRDQRVFLPMHSTGTALTSSHGAAVGLRLQACPLQQQGWLGFGQLPGHWPHRLPVPRGVVCACVPQAEPGLLLSPSAQGLEQSLTLRSSSG